LPSLPFLESRENRAEEEYGHGKHFLFSTQHPYVLELSPEWEYKSTVRQRWKVSEGHIASGERQEGMVTTSDNMYFSALGSD
jgi:hypothetical protein